MLVKDCLTLSTSQYERCKKNPITQIVVKHLLLQLKKLTKYLGVSHTYVILKQEVVAFKLRFL